MARYKNCIYRFLNDSNEIIYIGKAKNLKQRLSSHTHLPEGCYDEVKEIEFIMFDTEDDMDFAERYYIPKYNPVYNTIWSERKITLSIPDLDNKKWLKYTNDKDIEIQILKLEGKWTKQKALTTKEDYDVEIEKLKEELKCKTSKLDKIKCELREVESIINKHKFKIETERLYDSRFEWGSCVFRSMETFKEINIEFDEDFERLCLKSKLLQDKLSKKSKEFGKLSQKIFKLKEKRLLVVLGSKEVKELNDVLYYEYIEHEVYSKDDLLICKINHIRDKCFDTYSNQLKNKGFYNINDIVNIVYNDIGLGICPDKWTQEFNKEDLESSANVCIDKIKEKFTKIFGKFKQEIILSEEPAMLAPNYKIPTALLVMKLVA